MDPMLGKCTYLCSLKIIFFFLISSPVENNCEWQLRYMWISRTKRILLTLYDLFDDTEF